MNTDLIFLPVELDGVEIPQAGIFFNITRNPECSSGCDSLVHDKQKHL
jgi:hypothetical protein